MPNFYRFLLILEIIVMPRQRREYTTTGFYHIMMKGINKSFIFYSAKDKEHFLSKIFLYAKPTTEVHAYCLLDDHIHLLLRSTDISKFIHRVATSYSQWFNAQYSRVGYLFHGRYKSEVIEGEKAYIRYLKYILKDPVRLGLCKRCSDYQWSSFKGYYIKRLGIERSLVHKFFPNPTDFESFIDEVDESDSVDYDPLIKLSDEILEQLIKIETKGINWNYLKDSELRNVLLKLRKKCNTSMQQLSRVTKISYYRIRKLLS